MGAVISLDGTLSRRWNGPCFIARVTRDPNLPDAERAVSVLLTEGTLPAEMTGFRAILTPPGRSVPVGAVGLPDALGHLDSGDVVRIDPERAHLYALYRRASPNNSFLLTERCNSRCLMCSQPPRDVDDGYLVEDLLEAIPLISPDTEVIGFTGGEPTLLHDRFLRLLESTRDHLPHTHVDVLTNGRMFAYPRYADRVAAVEHPSLILCIPLYSEVDALHDFVVQAPGAFDQTVRGLLNLGRAGVGVEVRVVIHAQTWRRLPQLAEFLAMNLPFVSHVALMGLEVTGFTRANLGGLWVDPVEYQAELTEAVEILAGSEIPVSIYNHQLCILPHSLWEYAQRSISDWKNSYVPECEGCTVRDLCGGFFSTSGGRRSLHIRAL